MRFEPKQRFIVNIRDKESQKFIIPEYQRPYRWKIDECQTLWDDIINAFYEKKGDKNEKEGNEKFEYFLGSIVSFENDHGDLEIIDGQQRITTLTLLFRAFFESLKSEDKKDEQDDFGKFIWKKIRNKGFEFDKPYLSSQVITDKDKEELEYILMEDIDIEKLRKNFKSNYAKNFIFFHEAINDFKLKNARRFEELCDTILSDTFFVLCVTCDSQESAMTIFNTLNSRGMPLSNADIIKGYIYKNIENKEEFAKKWQEISSKFEEYNPKEDMSVLFIQAMHAIRAMNNHTDNTTPSVLDFFTKINKNNFGAIGGYLVKEDQIKELMKFIETLVYFWASPKIYLKGKAYRYFKILCLYQNDMWKFFVAFLIWRNKDNFIKGEFKDSFSNEFESNLLELLKAITIKFLNNRSSANEIRDLVFKMNAELNQNINFSYSKSLLEGFLNNFSSNDKDIKPDARKVKYLLYLYAHLYDDFSSDIKNYKLEVEHILPKTWQNANFDEWDKITHSEYLEQIGNKILLDKATNIKCANNFFSLKQETYKESQNSQEVRDLGNRDDKIWSKVDIESRNKAIEQALKNFINK